jgi:hypothetical protein
MADIPLPLGFWTVPVPQLTQLSTDWLWLTVLLITSQHGLHRKHRSSIAVYWLLPRNGRYLVLCFMVVAWQQVYMPQQFPNISFISFNITNVVHTLLYHSIHFTVYSYLFNILFSNTNSVHPLSNMRHYAKSQKVMGSIPDEVTVFFNWLNPSSHTMALGVHSAPNRNEYQEYSWE